MTNLTAATLREQLYTQIADLTPTQQHLAGRHLDGAIIHLVRSGTTDAAEWRAAVDAAVAFARAVSCELPAVGSSG